MRCTPPLHLVAAGVLHVQWQSASVASVSRKQRLSRQAESNDTEGHDMKLVKLSPTQARAIRESVYLTVNGRTVMRCAWVKGSNYKTYNRLFELGLIAGWHENAALTEVGVNAWAVLNESTDTRVLADRPTHVAHEVTQPEADEPAPVDTFEAPVRFEVRERSVGFAIVDRTDGTEVMTVNSRYAATYWANRMNREANPITWADIKGAPSEPDQDPWFTGGDQDTYLSGLRAAWRAGTRVTGFDSAGYRRTGTTNGNVGFVDIEDHVNWGRPWADITWDRREGAGWSTPCNVVFTDLLDRI